MSKTANQQPSVSLTELGVHVSMNSRNFSNACHWHLPLVRSRITVPTITKEACT